MNPIEQLQEIFSHFPGVGPRQAKRFVYYILNKNTSFTKQFASLIEEASKSVVECSQCHRVSALSSNLQPQASQLCSICSDPTRDISMLMIVARDSDFESIEKSGTYKGLYFILGGTVPILDKEPEKRIRLRTLLERISNDKIQSLKEIILSLNTTPEGEHTASIVKDAVVNMTKKLSLSPGLKVTVLGRGLSTGAELEYADSETIRNALSNRK